jgi:hypothetical protein
MVNDRECQKHPACLNTTLAVDGVRRIGKNILAFVGFALVILTVTGGWAQ